MTLVRYRRPFGELVELPELMERFFDEPWRPARWFSGQDLPMLDIRTTEEAYIIEAAIPGVDPKMVEITIDGHVLTIKGHFKEELKEEKEGYLVKELFRGAFSRSVTLPAVAESAKAEATFHEGLLTLTIPKVKEAQPIKVAVKEI
ncbi:MAG TPA: Hsp20/alpha crystallin family protein [Candidatus Limnocylindrales bacterium]|nr:Hsp20/alpha crystallin family protein [Candidatus Limnocylindrales bacterium]